MSLAERYTVTPNNDTEDSRVLEIAYYPDAVSYARELIGQADVYEVEIDHLNVRVYHEEQAPENLVRRIRFDGGLR